jgi:alpha-1,6-mannosyltransferase
MARNYLGRAAQSAARRYARGLYGRFDAVLAPSRYVTQRLRSLGIERVRHQPLGVDTVVFHPGARDPELRARLGLDPDTRLLVFAGRFAPEKNLPVLCEAFRRLGPRYHLLLIGGGMPVAAQANVTVLPFQTDEHALARLMASCDGLVHAGFCETFGLVVLEAMACGLPVVAADCAGLRELVSDAHGVRVAARGGAGALAEAVQALYGRDLALLGERARTTACRVYGWDSVMRSLLELYRDCAVAGYAGRSREAYA